MDTYRAFINQPSTLQPLHALHGARCIVQDNGEKTLRVFFTTGPVQSMQIPRICVSRLRISAAG
jgi:hypothetical protein